MRENTLRNGSGAVFFSGCPLGCVFCQNRAISHEGAGTEISVERLSDIFLELQAQGAVNVNLVTAGHYAPQVCRALRLARENGLSLPVVWNSSGYETVETLRMLEGLVDVYLPDLKYLDPALARVYSHAEDYPDVAKAAIREMVRQQPRPRFEERSIRNRPNGENEEDNAKNLNESDSERLMTAGVMVRHLLLPGHVREAKQVVSYLYETYGNQIYISLMNQYMPPGQIVRDNPSGTKLKKAASEEQSAKEAAAGKAATEEKTAEDMAVKNSVMEEAAAGIADTEEKTAAEHRPDPVLIRPVTKREYERLLDYAIEIGVTQGFYQEGRTALACFIPEFDGTGV